MAENGILDYQGMNQAIYRGATSNIVVDTQSMSIEIGAGNTSHTSNLHFECNHDANVASIKLNSNVVTEFPRSKKLIKYPRVALTSASDNAYENEYKVTYSNQDSTHKGFKAFDGGKGESSAQLWYSQSLSHYSTSDGSAVTSGTNIAPRLDTNTDYGEWIGIELPVAVKLTSFYLWQQYNDSQHFPQSGTIYAKKEVNDLWTEVYRYDGRSRTDTPDIPEIFNDVNSNIAYKYFVLVCRQRNQGANSTHGVALGEWELFGTPEYDPEADGVDARITSYPNVPNTDWLEVYYDAKGLSTMPSIVTDLSPNSNDGLLSDSPQVSNEAFVFDGVNDYIYNSQTGYTGGNVYTASAWIKKTANINGCVFQFGNGSNGNSIGIFYYGGTLDYIRAYVFGYAVANSKSSSIPLNEWIHVTGVYSDKTATLYINGIEVATGTGSTGITIPSTPYLTIGAQTNNINNPYAATYFTGSIANFRLFNRALTTDEIYQLYAYQKEHFGHGDLSMTLKAGRLGIGTSEPRAALDVRGVIRGTSPATFIGKGNTNTNVVPSATVLPVGNVIMDTAGSWDATTSRYYVKVPGIYFISVSRVTIETTGVYVVIYVYVNGSTSTQATIQGGSGSYPSGSLSTIVSVKEGDYIEIRASTDINYRVVGGYYDVRMIHMSM